MASPRYNLLQLFSKIYHEIKQVFLWFSSILQRLHVLIPEDSLVTGSLFELSILAIDFQ